MSAFSFSDLVLWITSLVFSPICVTWKVQNRPAELPGQKIVPFPSTQESRGLIVGDQTTAHAPRIVRLLLQIERLFYHLCEGVALLQGWSPASAGQNPEAFHSIPTLPTLQQNQFRANHACWLTRLIAPSVFWTVTIMFLKLASWYCVWTQKVHINLQWCVARVLCNTYLKTLNLLIKSIGFFSSMNVLKNDLWEERHIKYLKMMRIGWCHSPLSMLPLVYEKHLTAVQDTDCAHLPNPFYLIAHQRALHSKLFFQYSYFATPIPWADRVCIVPSTYVTK